ncbi:hypothetical protein N9599_00010 [Candidatus Pelagibacter sp.]|nr:hypothetical protein [Candidatus Pelagibacter sp.]
MFDKAVLMLTYNRADLFKKSLSSVLSIMPKRIYIFNDGPKSNPQDIVKVYEVRKLIQNIKTKSIIIKNFNKYNLGCKKSNLKAIDWFFSKEKEGIIIEDDCIASREFFSFTSEMLNKYKDNNRIFCISGSNFQKEKLSNESYYFSKYNHCWGWATWRDRWRLNDDKISFWPKFKKSKEWGKLHKNKIEQKYWNKIFKNVYNDKMDSWAYPWTLSVWKQKGLTITPNVNLVKNIGFGKQSTHSLFVQDSFKYLNKQKIDSKIIHPKKIIINNKADFYVFKNHFKGYNYIWPYRGFDLIKKFILNPFVFFKRIIN